MIEPTGYTALDLIGFTDRGAYDPTATYVKNDIVTVGNTKWRCKVDDTTGVTPAENANWTIYLESATSLAGMDDTDITSPKEYDILMHNGTEWENSDVLKEQEVITSKNLLYNNAVTCDIDGIHFEVNPDGTVLANRTGASTGTVTLGIGRLSSEYIGKTVKAVGCPAGGSATTYEFSDNGGVNRDRGDGVTFTYNNEYFQIAVRQTEPCNNVLFKPMITEDTDATYNDYEKYWKALKDAMWTKEQQKVNGAYNLCSNEKLKTQVVNSTLTVTFNPSGYPKGSVRLQGYVSTGQWISVNYRTMKLKQNQKYKLCGVIGGATSTYRLRYYDDAGGVASVYDDINDHSNAEFICKNPNTSQVDIYVNTGATSSNPIDTVIYPMITTDLNATYADYAPHAKTNGELTEWTLAENIKSQTSYAAGMDSSKFSYSVCKFGKVITVNFVIQSLAIPSTGWGKTDLVTGLPATIDGFSPRVAGYSMTNKIKFAIEITGDGKMRLVRDENTTTAENLPTYWGMSIVYIAK